MNLYGPQYTGSQLLTFLLPMRQWDLEPLHLVSVRSSTVYQPPSLQMFKLPLGSQ
jgi:hypothetical protein